MFAKVKPQQRKKRNQPTGDNWYPCVSLSLARQDSQVPKEAQVPGLAPRGQKQPVWELKAYGLEPSLGPLRARCVSSKKCWEAHVYLYKNKGTREFPGGPVVRIRCFP